MKLRLKIISGCLLLTAFMPACANVQQIDRGRLARKIMQYEPMPHQEAFVTEMHSIREGAAGGAGHSAGGGCGCN